MNKKLKFKIIIVIILQFLVFPVNAQEIQDYYNHKTAPANQLLPKVSLTYSLSDEIQIVNPYVAQVKDRLPDLIVRTGLEYIYKGSLSVYYDCRFWCRYQHRMAFAPEEAVFEVGASYNITNKIKVTISHACYHPLQSSGKYYNNHGQIFGGHTGFTISYGY